MQQTARLWRMNRGRYFLERFLVKAGIYAFLFSLGFGVLFTSKDMHFGFGTTVLPRSWGDYIFILLRFSIIVTIIVIVVTFFFVKKKMKDE